VCCNNYLLLSKASRTLDMANCLLWQLSIPAASTLRMRFLTQKSSRALALSACSSNPFISTRRVESATVALCF
jgi:hypothetical protein